MRRPVRWILGVVATALLLAGVAVWRAHAIADATIEGHLVSYRESLARIRATPPSRPALLAPEEPGDAKVLAQAFLEAVAALPSVDSTLLDSYDDAEFAAGDRDAQSALLERIQAPLDALGSMWHRTCRDLLPPDLGAVPVPGLSEYTRLRVGRAAFALAVRFARAAGRGEEALRRAGDWALHASDTSRQGTAVMAVVGVVEEIQALLALRKVLEELPLTGVALAQLSERLAALRASRPPVASLWTMERTLLEGMMADDALFGKIGTTGASDSRDPFRTWKSLYSTRVGRSNLLRDFARLPASLPVELSTEPWGTAAARSLELHGLDGDDPLLWSWMETWPFVHRRMTDRDFRFAVLELAVGIGRFEADHSAWPSTEADLVPKYLSAIPSSPLDPGGLRFAGNKAWSRGRDGDDDGGRPLSDADDWSADGEGDFVIEVKGHR